MAAIARSDGPYAFSFRSRRVSAATFVVVADKASTDEGAAAAATAAAPSCRNRCLREIVIGLSSTALRQRLPDLANRQGIANGRPRCIPDRGAAAGQWNSARRALHPAGVGERRKEP